MRWFRNGFKAALEEESCCNSSSFAAQPSTDCLLSPATECTGQTLMSLTTAFKTDEQFLSARLQSLRFRDQQTDLGQVPAPRSTLLALLWFSLVWVTKVWRGIS